MVIKNNARTLSVVFGENVRRLRLQARLSQESVSDQMGLSPSTIKYIEAGRGAKLITVELFAVFFKVPFQSLLEDQENG
jgi:transcriptional regulator with XRE-family HTH domain